jgi:hypothetical protein
MPPTRQAELVIPSRAQSPYCFAVQTLRSTSRRSPLRATCDRLCRNKDPTNHRMMVPMSRVHKPLRKSFASESSSLQSYSSCSNRGAIQPTVSTRAVAEDEIRSIGVHRRPTGRSSCLFTCTQEDHGTARQGKARQGREHLLNPNPWYRTHADSHEKKEQFARRVPAPSLAMQWRSTVYGYCGRYVARRSSRWGNASAGWSEESTAMCVRA